MSQTSPASSAASASSGPSATSSSSGQSRLSASSASSASSGPSSSSSSSSSTTSSSSAPSAASAHAGPTGRPRITRQRIAIGELLAETDAFRSAQQLHDRLRETGRPASLATVYRTLLALAEDGEVDQLRTEDGETLYRRCARSGHHHHLVCRSCGKTLEVAAPAAEVWARDIAARYGFTDADHTLEVFGTCPECAGGVNVAAAGGGGDQ